MYEGAPDWPERDRFWRIIETYGVTILYTAPTAIRAFMKWGTEHPDRHDLSTLRLLGSVGEPINPEAWMWYYEHIGGKRCPIVDTWWQTETGGIMITPLPGVGDHQARARPRCPFPGIRPELVDTRGAGWSRAAGSSPSPQPWPGMLRTIYNDDERYREVYWSRFPGRYFTGDGAKLDEDGYWWILGRVDDVLNVAGHRIGTMEVESALVDHPAVAEAAVVGRAHDLKGQAARRVRHPQGGAQGGARAQGRAQGARDASRSAPSPGRTRSSSPPTCPRPGAGRSCAGCSRTSPKGGRWATRRRSPIPAW